MTQKTSAPRRAKGKALTATRAFSCAMAGLILVGFLAIGMQIGMGYTDQLQIHVPLGITLFGIYLGMALLINTPKRRQHE
jgi:ABC-type transport system involved in cytochrome c biogenesis permease subunit